MSSSTNSSEDSRIVIGELRKKNPDGETESTSFTFLWLTILMMNRSAFNTSR